MSKSPVKGAWEVYQCQTCFLHGDPVNQKALQIQKNIIQPLKSIQKKQKQRLKSPLFRNERPDRRESTIRPSL